MHLRLSHNSILRIAQSNFHRCLGEQLSGSKKPAHTDPTIVHIWSYCGIATRANPTEINERTTVAHTVTVIVDSAASNTVAVTAQTVVTAKNSSHSRVPLNLPSERTCNRRISAANATKVIVLASPGNGDCSSTQRITVHRPSLKRCSVRLIPHYHIPAQAGVIETAAHPTHIHHFGPVRRAFAVCAS